MSRDWSSGSTRAWRRIRAAVLHANAMDNQGRCTLAIPGVCTGTADQVHHTKGKAYGDDPRYLVACCRACNLHIGHPRTTSPAPRPVSRW
jgi:hypothetical protein